MTAGIGDVAFATVVLIGLASPVTVAVLVDTGTAGNNAVSGGVLDLKLSEVGNATQGSTTDERNADAVRDTWEDRSHATDGSDAVENELALNTSDSSMAADSVNVTVEFAENDTSLDSDGDANETASSVQVKRFVYNGTDLVGTSLLDQDGNGIVDVQDLTHGPNADTLSSLSGVGADSTVALNVTLSGKSGLLSDLSTGVGSGDGIDIDIEIRASAGGFAESDVSRDNTIQYA